MTQWAPVWRVKIAGVDVTDSVLASLNITSGRTNIYEQAQAGYCSLTLIVFNQAAIDYEINDTLSVEVQDTSAVYKPIFGVRGRLKRVHARGHNYCLGRSGKAAKGSYKRRFDTGF
jgi:hypothetical protein